jgi:hypothetical protein
MGGSVNANTSESISRLRLLWPAIGGALLVAWTGFSQITWAHREGHLHGVPAFFLGVLVLLVVNALVRLCIGTWKRGLRWLISGEAWRLCGWTVVFVVSLVALFYAVELWRGKRAWASVVREANLRGEKLELTALVPPPVPDEQNFARTPFFTPLLAVSNGIPTRAGVVVPGDTGQFKFVARWEHWPFLSPYYGRGGVRPAPWLEAETTDLRSWMSFWRGWETNQVFDPNERPWTVPEVTPREAAGMLLASLRRQFDAELDPLRARSDRPYCRFPLDYSRQMFADAPPGQVLNGFMRILRLRASAALVTGDNEAALADLRLALRLADYTRQQPWVMQAGSRLVGLVDTLQPLWEGVVAHRWNAQQLGAVQAQLEALDLLSDYPLTVQNDAVALSSFVERIIPTSSATPRPIPLMTPEDADPLRLIRLVYPTGWSLQDQAAIHQFHLKTTSRYLDLHARRIVSERRGEPHGLFTSSDPIFSILTPKAWQMFADAAENFPFAQTAVDLATLACALERYRLANGEFPATLDALVPQFVARLPHDVITGEPLKYRRTDGGGFVLYSVGYNKTDDGGKPCVRYKDLHGQPAPRFNLDQNDWVWVHPDRKPGA